MNEVTLKKNDVEMLERMGISVPRRTNIRREQM